MSSITKRTTGGGGGGVTSFSFTDANGFDGTVINPTSSVNLTLATSVGDFEVIYANSGALTGTGVGTAGQVLTSNGAGVAPSFQTPGGLAYTNVTNAMSPYTVLANDYFLSVDATGGAVTILLPDAPANTKQFIIKDREGQAQINNITIQSATGAATIDQQVSYVFVDAFESLESLFHTNNYEVF